MQIEVYALLLSFAFQDVHIIIWTHIMYATLSRETSIQLDRTADSS